MAEIDPLAFQKGFQATQSIFDNARQNRLADLAMGQKMREIDQQNALAQIVGNAANYDAAGNLKREALPQIAQASPGQYGAFRQQISQQDAATAAAQKAKREELGNWIKFSQERMANVGDQAGWDNFRAEASQVFPEYAGNLPAAYDPARIAQAQKNSIPYLDQLKLGQNQQQFDAQQATTRRGQDMSASTAAAGRDVTMRGQDMTDQRARDLNATKAADNKAAQAQADRVREANDALGLLDQAEKLIPNATGSYLGQGIDMAAAAVGKSTPGAQAAAQLKALEGALVSKMPRMSGPQSDKDVAMYRQMAGKIGDASIPGATKLAAIKTIREIQNKYAGNAAAPASQSPVAAPVAQDAAIQELRRRAATDPALAAKLKAMGY